MTKALPVAVGQKTQQRRSWQSTKELYYTAREIGCWSEDTTAAIMAEY